MSRVERVSGRALPLRGHDIDTDTMNARGAIGIVPQELNMDPFFSPAEALEIQAGYYGVPKEEREKSIQRVADMLQITHLLDRKVERLSGGEVLYVKTRTGDRYLVDAAGKAYPVAGAATVMERVAR